MDVFLGAAAIVLILLTVWIVWRPATPAAAAAPVEEENPATMLPQGDAFEDQYTSATADLSAGAVAITNATSHAPPEAELPESAPALPVGTPETPLALPEPAPRQTPVKSIGAAALLTLGSAIGGAWLYARWQQRQRGSPLDRLRRRFR